MSESATRSMVMRLERNGTISTEAAKSLFMAIDEPPAPAPPMAGSGRAEGPNPPASAGRPMTAKEIADDLWPKVLAMPMSFGGAVEALKAGHRVTRAGWIGKGMWLALSDPDEGSKMTLPYIFMRTADRQLVPWLASQTDMLAVDWMRLG